MLNALSLAQIPLHAVDRTDDDPIVLSGGHASFNPEPIADFVDAVALGDGAEIVLKISGEIKEFKEQGSPGGGDEQLFPLAPSAGCCVTQFFGVAVADLRGEHPQVTDHNPGLTAR